MFVAILLLFKSATHPNSESVSPGVPLGIGAGSDTEEGAGAGIRGGRDRDRHRGEGSREMGDRGKGKGDFDDSLVDADGNKIAACRDGVAVPQGEEGCAALVAVGCALELGGCSE